MSNFSSEKNIDEGMELQTNEIVSMNINIDIAHVSKHYKGLHAAIQK